jgi:class 3 adenylate cyclase
VAGKSRVTAGDQQRNASESVLATITAAPSSAAVNCAIEIRRGMIERNAGLPPERRIEFRVGIHVGDVVEESDGDLWGKASISPRGSKGSPRRALISA